MKRRTNKPRAGKAKRAGTPKGPRTQGWDLAIALAWTLFWLVPLVYAQALGDSFRLPKLLVTETLAVAILAALAWRMRGVSSIDWRGLLRLPVVRALGPMLLIATAGLAFTAHPIVVRGPLISLWIAVASIVGWQLGFRLDELRRLLRGLIVPATLLAVIAVLDYHGVINLFALRGDVDARFSITSLAGGPFDLAAYLVLPILLAQAVVWTTPNGRQRYLWAGALAVCLYAVALTQTFTAVLAIIVGSTVLWARLLPRRAARTAAGLALVGAVVTIVLVLATPLGDRLRTKAEHLRAGEIDRVLTGRLDPWKAAWWMLREHPLTGVGHGAYRAEFAPAKLALRDEGVRFYRFQHIAHFDNAHNEFLEAGASWGWPGLIALAWGIVCLAQAGRRVGRRAAADASEATADRAGQAERAVALAGLVALAVMAATYFPCHLRLVAYPYWLLIAAVFAADRMMARAATDEVSA